MLRGTEWSSIVLVIWCWEMTLALFTSPFVFYCFEVAGECLMKPICIRLQAQNEFVTSIDFRLSSMLRSFCRCYYYHSVDNTTFFCKIVRNFFICSSRTPNSNYPTFDIIILVMLPFVMRTLEYLSLKCWTILSPNLKFFNCSSCSTGSGILAYKVLFWFSIFWVAPFFCGFLNSCLDCSIIHFSKLGFFLMRKQTGLIF